MVPNKVTARVRSNPQMTTYVYISMYIDIFYFRSDQLALARDSVQSNLFLTDGASARTRGISIAREALNFSNIG